MCGIVGIFNEKDAQNKVATALAVLQNRGKDSSNTLKVQAGILGHTLHAIVGHVQQPLQGRGVLVANCEIYNWQALNKKYGFAARNDAELLLQFLDKFINDLPTKLAELDGVYAFAYHKDNHLTLARDIIGVKPLWFSYKTDGLAFASEKKALEKVGYEDIQELNPRQILQYTGSELSTIKRDFFTYLPEHERTASLQLDTEKLLDSAIQKRVPQKKFGLLFSGGIDSTYIAKHLKDRGYDFICYTAVLDTDTAVPSDLAAAQQVAEELGLKLKVRKIKMENIPTYLKKIIPLIEDSNVVKVGVGLTFYLACEMAKEDGCKVIFSGLGSEEIFAGYERHKSSANINQECVSGLLKMYERDLYRDDVITMDNNLELRLPFLDKTLVEFALRIPESLKIVDGKTKYILRQIALGKGIPEQFSFRKKVAAQYGSRLDNALGKLAKKNGFSSKSSYLRSFYPSHNLKLGVLFSSGKDSTSAAYIMQQQNYQLSCLITMRSTNPESYMFQTAGTELVGLQAKAMDLPLVEVKTAGEKEAELKDLHEAIQRAKELHNIDGIVTGALFSTYQRDRIEKICDSLGLKIFSPLWHKPQQKHMEEVIGNGFEAVITAVAADGLDSTWLGRKIDGSLLRDLKKIHAINKINIAAEGGEFESLVLDGPLFEKRIVIDHMSVEQIDTHSARLIIDKAHLEEKKA